MMSFARSWRAGAALSTIILMAGISVATADPLTDQAQAAILANFEGETCPAVFVAKKNPDGSIDALCTNGETFLIGKVSTGEVATIQCSAFDDRFSDFVKKNGCTRWSPRPEVNEAAIAAALCTVKDPACTPEVRQQLKVTIRLCREDLHLPIDQCLERARRDRAGAKYAMAQSNTGA